MYEVLEHWNQYKKEKELNSNSNKKELSDNSRKLVSEYDKETFDIWMNDLIKSNGITKY